MPQPRLRQYDAQPGLVQRVFGALQPPRGMTPWASEGWVDDVRTSDTLRRRRRAARLPPWFVLLWCISFLAIVAYIWWRSVRTGGEPLWTKEMPLPKQRAGASTAVPRAAGALGSDD